MKNKIFYAVHYWSSNRGCTTGSPNPLTGRMSIACYVVGFTSRGERDRFVIENRARDVVTKSGLRRLMRGLTLVEFAEEINSINFRAMNKEIF